MEITRDYIEQLLTRVDAFFMENTDTAFAVSKPSGYVVKLVSELSQRVSKDRTPEAIASVISEVFNKHLGIQSQPGEFIKPATKIKKRLMKRAGEDQKREFGPGWTKFELARTKMAVFGPGQRSYLL